MADPKKEIDYRLRPAKHVERYMICEALHQLSHFGGLRQYRYIGFGAKYFVDFALFHRSLGFDKMVSIEKDTNELARYEWNKPFKCIKIHPGMSTEVLPKLDWKPRTVLWLDYDGALDKDALADVSFFFANAQPGSVFISTVNAHLDMTKPEDIDALRERLDLPAGTENAALKGFGLATVLRKVIDDKIAETLASRNAALSPDKKVRYTQLFHFHYMDSVRMLTVGGIVWDSGSTAVMDQGLFDHLEFARKGEEAFLIDVPSLTPREIRYLDTHLPIGGSKPLPKITPIPDTERDKYRHLYRYFPSYADADL